MSKINGLLAADVERNEALERAVEHLENKRKELKRDYAFIKELIRQCDEAIDWDGRLGVSFEGKIDTYYNGGLREIDRSLLPLARKAAGWSISKKFSTAENADTVRVYVILKSGVFKDLEFSYLAPAPKGKKCKVKEVTHDSYTSFELVCEK